MRKIKFNKKKPKALNGAGRQTAIKHLVLPADVVADIKFYKYAYEDVLGESVTLGQMMRRWIDNVKRFDPAVAEKYAYNQQFRFNAECKQAMGLGLSHHDYVVNLLNYDPTEGEVWKLRYTFERDGEELKAIPEKERGFVAEIDGEVFGMVQLMADGWELQSEIGTELDTDQARRVSQIILEHQEQKGTPDGETQTEEEKRVKKPALGLF